MQPASERRARIAGARLYFICDAQPGGRRLADVLGDALAGGVDIFQLRDKDATDDELLRAAATARRLCDDAGALFIMNDRPDLASESGADGVHIGQEDGALEQVREFAGPDLLIGRSTHSPQQIAAAHDEQADYLGVGPVYATPTKPGRAAVGLALVRHAAGTATRPWFAIGGITPVNLSAVLGAGASRLAVVREIADADDPRAAASALRATVTSEGADALR